MIIYSIFFFLNRFALQNGIITEICPQEQDEEWVLNFKRGVLSLFQNSMSRFDIDFDGLEVFYFILHII